MKKVEQMQNSAARFVFQTNRLVSASKLLFQLHCLSVAQRIEYKCLCIMFSVDRRTAPLYLLEMFEKNTKSRSTARQSLFRLPKCTNETTRRSFAYQGAKRWNALPENLRMEGAYEIFKKKLKTLLFCKSFK